MARQAACRRSAPAARWMAPSTPPPPRRRRLAALTTASTRSAVMSPCTAWSSGAIGRPTRRWLDDEEAGTSFSSEKACVGADWLLFSPQFENVTMPWMADAPPGVAGVGHLLDRERRAAGRDVEHDGHLAAALGGDRAEDGHRLLAGHGGGLAVGVGPADLELLGHLRGEQPADELGEAAVRGREGEPLAGVLRRLGLGEADHVLRARPRCRSRIQSTRPPGRSCAR